MREHYGRISWVLAALLGSVVLSVCETTMDLILVSRDADLEKLCREVLNEFPGVDWVLMMAAPGSRPLAADLYIWDSPSRVELKMVEQRFAKHLLLVHRNEIADLREALGNTEAAFLLKPLTRACLSAFLGFATSNWQDRASATSLRADRDEMLQCLIQSNLQIQEYDQDRTNFLARALHDFRAPLTATTGYCGLLLSDALGATSEEQKEVLRRMHHSLKRLSRMASAMFELSVGRHVKQQPVLRRADIRNCVDQALHEVTPFADAKRLTVTVDLDPEGGNLYLESGQIEQLLMNLLDNACKFTPSGGSIEVRGYPYFWERRMSRGAPTPDWETPLPRYDRRRSESRSPNSYRVDVRDSGPHIPREHMDKIFEEYTSYRGGQDRSGGGLGLAICRMIMTAHHGRVWAENTQEGPQFSFVLPARPVETGQPGGRQPELITSE